MRWGLLAGAMLIGVSLNAPVWAQGDKGDTSEEDDKRARMLFELGDEHYKQGRYAEALVALEEAYELSGRKALLFNMANALEKLGRDEDALEKLEAYAPHAPEARREEIATRITELKKRIEAKTPAPVPEPPAPVPEPPAPVPEPPPVVPAPQTPLAPVPEPPPPDTAMMPTAIAGYALLGVGAVGIGLGAVFGGIALGARSDAEASCEQNADRQHCLTDASAALDDDARFSIAADVAFGIGIVSAITGGVLVIHSFVASPSSGGQALNVAVKNGELRVIGTF